MTAVELSTRANAAVAVFLASVLTSPTQVAAHAAAVIGIALAVAGAFVRTMMPLRWLAVGSAAGLAVYGALRPSPITFFIASALLPINVYRAIEVMRLTQRVQRAGVAADLAGVWLKPYMKTRRFRAGRVLFARGDRADKLYLLVSGQLVLDEIDQPLEPGRIFGEIALFSHDRTRTQTVRCVTACTVLWIDESTVRQLYFQDPAFGFHLIELLASRLGSDVQRARDAVLGERPPALTAGR